LSSVQVPEGSGQLPFARRIALGWDIWLDARKLPYQIGDTDLSVALAWADVAPDPRWNGVSADFIVRRVRRSVKHPILMRHRRCMRGGLLGFKYLRKAGFDPVLKFALVEKSLATEKLDAHCWVCLNDTPVISDREDGMTDLMEFPRPTPA